jgi:hypothetical protein
VRGSILTVQEFSFKPCSSLSLLLAESFSKRARASSTLRRRRFL